MELIKIILFLTYEFFLINLCAAKVKLPKDKSNLSISEQNRSSRQVLNWVNLRRVVDRGSSWLNNTRTIHTQPQYKSQYELQLLLKGQTSFFTRHARIGISADLADLSVREVLDRIIKIHTDYIGASEIPCLSLKYGAYLIPFLPSKRVYEYFKGNKRIPLTLAMENTPLSAWNFDVPILIEIKNSSKVFKACGFTLIHAPDTYHGDRVFEPRNYIKISNDESLISSWISSINLKIESQTNSSDTIQTDGKNEDTSMKKPIVSEDVDEKLKDKEIYLPHVIPWNLTATRMDVNRSYTEKNNFRMFTHSRHGLLDVPNTEQAALDHYKVYVVDDKNQLPTKYSFASDDPLKNQEFIELVQGTIFDNKVSYLNELWESKPEDIYLKLIPNCSVSRPNAWSLPLLIDLNYFKKRFSPELVAHVNEASIRQLRLLLFGLICMDSWPVKNYVNAEKGSRVTHFFAMSFVYGLPILSSLSHDSMIDHRLSDAAKSALDLINKLRDVELAKDENKRANLDRKWNNDLMMIHWEKYYIKDKTKQPRENILSQFAFLMHELKVRDAYPFTYGFILSSGGTTMHPKIPISNVKDYKMDSISNFFSASANHALIGDLPNHQHSIFGNKIFGGGVFGHGYVQEEVLLSIRPELLVFREIISERPPGQVAWTTGSIPIGRRYPVAIKDTDKLKYFDIHIDPLDRIVIDRNSFSPMDFLIYSDVPVDDIKLPNGRTKSIGSLSNSNFNYSVFANTDNLTMDQRNLYNWELQSLGLAFYSAKITIATFGYNKQFMYGAQGCGAFNMQFYITNAHVAFARAYMFTQLIEKQNHDRKLSQDIKYLLTPLDIRYYGRFFSNNVYDISKGIPQGIELVNSFPNYDIGSLYTNLKDTMDYFSQSATDPRYATHVVNPNHPDANKEWLKAYNLMLHDWKMLRPPGHK